MSMVESVEVTIKTAIAAGIIDRKLHAAPIEAVRMLAERADAMSDSDNVTLPTMLKYLGAMGIVDIPKRGRPPKEKPETDDAGRMDGMRGRLYGKLKAV